LGPLDTRLVRYSMLTAPTHSIQRHSLGAAFVVVATVGAGPFAGCDAARDQGREQRRMLDALTSARDAVCGCRDLDCAESAERRLADFLLLHVDSLKKLPAPARPSGAGRADTATVPDTFASQAARLDGELRACKHRLEEAASAS
jgi:hypothetical protein